jgi:hypothetical protein
MKTLLAVVCLFCASAATGQMVPGGSVLNNQPQVFQVESHNQHASQHALAEPRTLETYNNVSAHGVRPLWEVAPATEAVPLGDAARMLRKQHAAMKKAEIVWEN